MSENDLLVSSFGKAGWARVALMQKLREYWITGTETGLVFWDEVNGSGFVSGVFPNWRNPGSSEPGGGTGENNLHFHHIGIGKWNDAEPTGGNEIVGYYVESETPESSYYVLILSGFIGLVVIRRKKNEKRN